MKININTSLNLLQEIRVIHALCDYGAEIYCTRAEYNKLIPIKEIFNGNINIGYSDEGENITDLLSIIHDIPITQFKNDKKPLIFPLSLIDFCQKNNINKTSKIYFRGKITNQRKGSIERLKKQTNVDIVIKTSIDGRKFPVKTFDIEYFNEMKNFKFIFCPDGDFIWTYRFFETVMCGGIPIIENEAEIYQGFKYYKLGDNLSELQWRPDWVSHNIEILKEKFTL